MNEDQMDLPYSPESQKLTDWANEPTLTSLKEDFEAAKNSHTTQMQRIQRWNDLMKVEGKSKPAKVKGRSSVQPKLIRRQAEWRYSALSEPFLSSPKLFNVTPASICAVQCFTYDCLVVSRYTQTGRMKKNSVRKQGRNLIAPKVEISHVKVVEHHFAQW